MNLTFHLIKKDARRLALPLGLFYAIVVADLLLGVCVTLNPPWVWNGLEQIQLFHNFLLVTLVASSYMLTAALVHEDSLLGTRSFWPTRPISRPRLLAAKLLALVLLLWLPPILLTLPWWLNSGLSLAEMGNAAAEQTLHEAIITLPAFALASVTANLGPYLGWTAASLLAVGLGTTQWFTKTYAGYSPAGEDLLQYALFVFVVGWFAAGVFQFLTGRLTGSVLLIAAVGLVGVGLARLGEPLAVLLQPSSHYFASVGGDYSAKGYFVPDPATASTLALPLKLTLGQISRHDDRSIGYLGSPEREGMPFRKGDLMLSLLVQGTAPLPIVLPDEMETTVVWPGDGGRPEMRQQVRYLMHINEGVELQTLAEQWLASGDHFALPPSDTGIYTYTDAFFSPGRLEVSAKTKLSLWQPDHPVKATVGGTYPIHSPSAMATAADIIGLRANLAVRRAEPAAGLLQGLLNQGDCFASPCFVLRQSVGGEIMVGFDVDSTARQSRHLRVGGVGILLGRVAFDDLRDEHQSQVTKPTLVSRRQRMEEVRHSLDGATIWNLDFRFVGFVETEAVAEKPALTQLPASYRPVLAAASAASDMISTIRQQTKAFANDPKYDQVYIDLWYAMDAMESSARRVLADDGSDAAVTAGLRRALAAGLDRTIVCINGIAGVMTMNSYPVAATLKLNAKLSEIRSSLPADGN